MRYSRVVCCWDSVREQEPFEKIRNRGVNVGLVESSRTAGGADLRK